MQIIIFKKLTKDVLEQILEKIINEIENRLTDLNVKINLTANAKQYFIDNGYDEIYGARPLKRLVSKTLEVNLAKLLIENKIKFNDKLIIDYNNQNIEIVISKEYL